MANYFPLIVNAGTAQIQELPLGDNLDLTGSSISAVTNVTASGSLTVNSSNGATAIVNGGTNGTGNIGSSTTGFNTIYAKSTSAQYADLAEKYLPDTDYEIGTVVTIGGSAEITACTWGDRAIGAISANPAYMMNRDLENGVYVALKGRVPVKVIGSVVKGQRLIAGNMGCAVAAVPHSNDVFAIALESNSDTAVKIVEAVIL